MRWAQPPRRACVPPARCLSGNSRRPCARSAARSATACPRPRDAARHISGSTHTWHAGAHDPRRSEHGTACLPGREARFRDDLEIAVRYARAAGCRRVHCMAGLAPPDADHARLHATYVSNLKYAARRLADEGMQLLIEPLSERTVAGCFLTGSAQAARTLDEVAAPNAFIQYDLFHMQIMEGNLAATIERLLPRIGHMQLADVPGRHEPGTGEINFAFLLAHVDRVGYSGWIGCEYNPAGDTLEGLKWAKPYL